MHEMSLAEGVLQLIEAEAGAQGFTRVTRVCLEIGQLSSVEPEALAFCFDAVTQGSIAAGASLELQAVAGCGWCLPCGQTVALTRLYDACPRCGGYQVQVTGGTEMRVKELEVE